MHRWPHLFIDTISELTQALKDASSFDTFSAVKDRICFNDRPSVCKYLANLDRGHNSITIRSHGDYIRGVCNRGNQCPFAILFSRRGRIGRVRSDGMSFSKCANDMLILF